MKTKMEIINKIVFIAFFAAVLFVAGCATYPNRYPLPEEHKDAAQIPYIPDARFWGDELPPHILERLEEERIQIQLKEPEAKNKPIDYLALSGGGGDGAFGAGLLVGWTAAGNRPEFRAVSGISTGALTAPFAFLGPGYDEVLRELYTTTSTDEIIKRRSFTAMINSDSVNDNSPLRQLVSKVINGAMLERIAIEHKKGRRLFIGTTNLYAKRPVVWDVGAIAASGATNALALVRDVLIASAAIPGLFPPVYVKVEANGQVFDELHVDGGVASQVFLYAVSLDLRWMEQQIGLTGEDRIFVIRNSQLDPKWTPVKPTMLPIMESSIETLIRTQGIGDLYRIYLGAQRDDLDYHLAYIPSDFDERPSELFDPEYMKKVFDLGFELAKDGYPWEKTPPGLTPPTKKGP